MIEEKSAMTSRYDVYIFCQLRDDPRAARLAECLRKDFKTFYERESPAFAVPVGERWTALRTSVVVIGVIGKGWESTDASPHLRFLDDVPSETLLILVFVDDLPDGSMLPKTLRDRWNVRMAPATWNRDVDILASIIKARISLPIASTPHPVEIRGAADDALKSAQRAPASIPAHMKIIRPSMTVSRAIGYGLAAVAGIALLSIGTLALLAPHPANIALLAENTPANPEGSQSMRAQSATSPSQQDPAPPTADVRTPLRIPDEQQRQATIQREMPPFKEEKLSVHVRELLTAARNSMLTGAWLTPNGNCARDQYLAILHLRPKQPEALQGTRHLADLLVEEASRYEAFGDLFNATYMIHQASMLQPTHPRLGSLQAKLIQLQANPTKLDQRDRTHLEHVDQYVGRAHERLQKLPFDAHTVGDATDLYDAALAEEPNAPGLPSLRSQLIAAYPLAVQTERSMRAFSNATMLMDAARKRGLVTTELERASKSALRLQKPE